MDIKIKAWDGSQMLSNDVLSCPSLSWGEISKGDLILRVFTGVTDNDGVEIYDGDILQNEYGKFAVYWRKEFACWQIKSKDGHIEFLANFLGNRHTDSIIGNIYENPELMNK